MRDSDSRPIRTLFICQQNRKRSATAERVFAKDPTLDVRSAGTATDALVQVNRRMIEWADVIFFMDDGQRRDLGRMFPGDEAVDRAICLDIPDLYPFLDPELVTLLRERTRPHLDALRDAGHR